VSDTTVKLIESAVVVVGLFTLRWMTLRGVHRLVDDHHVWYRTRRVATYTTTVVALITLVWIWFDAFGSLLTYLGLVSAGVAIALSDLLKNMAGWIYILARRPFRIGDRIEVDGTAGDVVDIRLFRFSLMEIGDWVDADQSTGRLVHVPNQVVFTSQIANYTEGFEYIWHEIPVLITFESDWERAKTIIREEVRAASIDVDVKARERLRETAREYRIKIGTLTPTVYLTVRDSGVLLTGRLLVAAQSRRGVEERVWEALLRRFATESDIELAYPTIRTYYEGPVRVERGPDPSGTDVGKGPAESGEEFPR